MTEQDILNKKEPYESYSYCYFNQDTKNIKLHEEIVSKDPQSCYYFAKDIKCSNKEYLFKEVLKSGNLHFIKLFYNEVDFDKSKFETLMLFI